VGHLANLCRSVALKSNGADSSGLTETAAELSSKVEVRLSEQQVVSVGVVVGAGRLLAGDGATVPSRIILPTLHWCCVLTEQFVSGI
jgi:hypothetical protein